MSQHRAEAMVPPHATALISITDPARGPAQLKAGWHSVLRLAFDDVDPVTFPGQHGHLQEISSDQVAEIASFAATRARCCKRLVVHCRHGVSRSAAVARAVAAAAALPFPDGYDAYNRYVFLVLRRAVRYAFDEPGDAQGPIADGGE